MPISNDPSWTGFVSGLSNMMKAWARASGANGQDASDIVQDAMVEASEERELLARLGDRQRAAWLKRVIRTKAIDADRHAKRSKRSCDKTCSLDQFIESTKREQVGRFRDQTPIEPADPGTAPSGRASRRELLDRLLGEIPEGDRRVCELCLRQDRTIAEIASDLEMPHAEVQERFTRGLAGLGKAMKRAMRHGRIPS